MGLHDAQRAARFAWQLRHLLQNTEGVRVGDTFLLASVVDAGGDLVVHAYDCRARGLYEGAVPEAEWAHLAGPLRTLSAPRFGAGFAYRPG